MGLPKLIRRILIIYEMVEEMTKACKLPEGMCGFALSGTVSADTILIHNPSSPTDLLVVKEYGSQDWRIIRPTLILRAARDMPRDKYGWAFPCSERELDWSNVFPKKDEKHSMLVFRGTNEGYHCIKFN